MTRRFLVALTFALFAPCVELGCSAKPNPETAEATGQIKKLGDRAPIDEAVAANSDFAVDLYRQLTNEEKNLGKNVFFSPYSVFCALAMTAEGARGETAAQMGKTLHFPNSLRNTGDDVRSIPWNMTVIHAGMAALDERFNPKAAEQQYELRVANALWGEKTCSFEQSYLDTINKFYRSGGIFPMEFSKHPEAARQKINAWVEERTKKRIKDLIARGDIDESTRLVLTNAIYFKGDWLQFFPEKETKEDNFIVATGKTIRVRMMHGRCMDAVRYGAFRADGSFFETPAEVPARASFDSEYPGKGGFLIAELPYKGGDLSMVVIVPQDPNGLGQIEKNLCNSQLQTWVSKLQKRPVDVYMPKFKLEVRYELVASLAAMGMARAFVEPTEPNGAQFDGICAAHDPYLMLYITKVLHKVFIEVNEKGSEAAAATAVLQAISPSVPAIVPFTPTFRADRPFIFAIRDVKTGTILFLGRMMNPNE
jgi:serpin B